MYINAYKETCDNLYLVKGPSLLPMISYEIEKILYKDDVCETAQNFLPKLKEIKRFADRYDDVASFILELKENVHIEIQGFKFLIERTPSDHVWASVEYTYYDAYTMDDVTYTSVIEHIDDVD